MLLVGTTRRKLVNFPSVVQVVNMSQYWLRQGTKGLGPIKADLFKEGVLIPTLSPFNSLVWPVL